MATETETQPVNHPAVEELFPVVAEGARLLVPIVEADGKVSDEQKAALNAFFDGPLMDALESLVENGTIGFKTLMGFQRRAEGASLFVADPEAAAANAAKVAESKKREEELKKQLEELREKIKKEKANQDLLASGRTVREKVIEDVITQILLGSTGTKVNAKTLAFSEFAEFGVGTPKIELKPRGQRPLEEYMPAEAITLYRASAERKESADTKGIVWQNQAYTRKEFKSFWRDKEKEAQKKAEAAKKAKEASADEGMGE